MSGTGRCMVRRVAGLVGVLVAVALVAAPAALANGDTITAQATVQFSGPVDNPTSCSPTATGSTATIDWGDSTAASNGTISGNVVSGTHTYAASGTYFGTVTISSGSGCSSGATDSFTANVSKAPPKFTQCPAVYLNNGCQFLITVNNGTQTVTEDTNQGPYEGADDALIGVQNNSSSPVSQLPLAVPNSQLFGFEQDGICTPGGPPVPSGCVPQAGAPAGTDCTAGQGGYCSFPAPANEPAGYVEPGAVSGVRQNGYEGPTSWFSNVSADTSSGVVHFFPAIPPGGSTYFSLEEPPTGTTIGVGGTSPSTPGLSPPTVKGTGVSFSALVNPNGQATTAYFQYGLDLKYSKFKGSGPNYTNSTPKQSLTGDFNDHLVSAHVAGLVPNALYHARLVAQNGSGTTFGPDVTFFTGKVAPPGAPTLGQTFNIVPVNGLVLIKLHGKFVPLTQIRQIPKNTLINAIHGTLQIIAATGGHPTADVAAKGKKRKGKVKTQTGRFGGAIFKVSQAHNGLTTMTLVEGAVKGGPSYAKCKGKAADVTATAARSRTLQLLRSSAKGKFRTRGKYAAATVRGTKWTTADLCTGTQVHVVTGTVAVTDFPHHKTVVLHHGQSYLAKKP
jgi:PKD domain-containing protein